MNAELRRYILFLANVVVVVCSLSGTDIPVIYVCPEESIQAFQNINFDYCKSNVYLTRHLGKDRKHKRIADWSFKNCVLNATFQTEYDHRFSLHKNGTITIQNVQPQDSGEYDVIYENDNLPPLIHEVQVYVMVAPTRDCKPSVTNTGNVLKVSVNPSGCGEPMVNVYWKCMNRGTDIDKTLFDVKAGTKTCAYHYCIEGPALRCASNLSHINYCFPSNFTMQDPNPQPSSEAGCNSVYVYLFIGTAVLLVGIIAGYMILCLKRSGKCATRCKPCGGGQSSNESVDEGTSEEDTRLNTDPMSNSSV